MLYLISRKLQLSLGIPKPSFVLLYPLSLPLAPAINTYRSSIITVLVLLFGGLLWQRYSRRDIQIDIDGSIVLVIYCLLMLETYRNDSFLGNLWLIRWLSRISSSKRSLGLYLVLWLAIRRVTPAYYNWVTISAAARVLSDSITLCLAALFFDGVDSVRQNRDFIVDLIRQWISTYALCPGFQLLISCGVKLVQGYFWFSFEVLAYSTL